MPLPSIASVVRGDTAPRQGLATGRWQRTGNRSSPGQSRPARLASAVTAARPAGRGRAELRRGLTPRWSS